MKSALPAHPAVRVACVPRVREQPEQQPPPVQRLRMRYAKRGRLRFTSHRDFSRAFERAVFRARIPMAYSSGFNPHPRISYAGAAPTGSASEAEYLEIALAEEVDPAWAHADIDEALPDGLDVLEVVPSAGGVAGGPARGVLVAAHLLDDGTARRRAAAVERAARDRRGDGRADDQEGPAQLRRAAAIVAAAVGDPPARTDRRVRYSTWSCGTVRRP